MDKSKNQAAKDSKQNVWDDTQQLTQLRDRAQRTGDPLSKVLFQASLQTLENQQQAQAFRQRITEVLAETDGKQSVAKTSIDQPEAAPDQPAANPAHEHHLQAPKPVVVYEDPLQYKAPNPTRVNSLSDEQIEQVQEKMDQSRETAILMEEARSELLPPLMGLVASIGLILLIGMGAYFKGWISAEPHKATADPIVQPTTESISPAKDIQNTPVDNVPQQPITNDTRPTTDQP